MGKTLGISPFLMKEKQLIAGGKWVRIRTAAGSAHFGSDLLRQAIIFWCVCLLPFELSVPEWAVAGVWTCEDKYNISLQDQNPDCGAHTVYFFFGNVVKQPEAWHYR